ncbi:MAG: membrane protein insertion efficiency factor YidD [Proteobacteria bacterium]|nr:membrane protein insertion efficiency factor YidD [Pseudomonadota bacterium]
MEVRRLFLVAIRGYQRYLSRHKGFHCAYRVVTGRRSCSELGFRAIRRYGIFAGMAILKQRTHLCGVAHRRQHPLHAPAFHSQRGFCDIGCDQPCELPSLHACTPHCDGISCCDFANCDWPSRGRKPRDEEQYVYIPPSRVPRH